MKSFTVTVLAALSLLLAACGSTPQSTYYLLSPMAGNSPGSTEPSLVVGPVTTPEYLQRNNLVLHNGQHQLTIEQYARWAEPLDRGMNRIIAVNLAQLLNTQAVHSFPLQRGGEATYGVELNVAQLSVKSGQARLVTHWILTDRIEQSVLVQRISDLSASAPDTNGSTIARVYSDLMEQLSREIADAITAAENRQD